MPHPQQYATSLPQQYATSLPQQYGTSLPQQYTFLSPTFAVDCGTGKNYSAPCISSSSPLASLHPSLPASHIQTTFATSNLASRKQCIADNVSGSSSGSSSSSSSSSSSNGGKPPSSGAQSLVMYSERTLVRMNNTCENSPITPASGDWAKQNVVSDIDDTKVAKEAKVSPTGEENKNDKHYEMHCKVCRVSMNAQAQAKQHYEGRSHARRLRMYIFDKKTNNDSKTVSEDSLKLLINSWIN